MMHREAKLLEKINVLVDGSHWQGMRKLKKGDRSGKGGHIGCSEGFNFNLYKQHLDMEVNSQGREQMHSLLEKCTQSLRLLSYRHFMIFLRKVVTKPSFKLRLLQIKLALASLPF